MNFYINQYNTLPLLSFKIIFDDEQYKNELLNCDFYISMWKENDCKYIIRKDKCDLQVIENCDDICKSSYYINYQFQSKYTKNKGNYKAKIHFIFNKENKMDLPLNEDLNIIIK